jgi:hypothetical protein
MWTGLTWLMVDSCEHSNEPLGFLKGGEFLE